MARGKMGQIPIFEGLKIGISPYFPLQSQFSLCPFSTVVLSQFKRPAALLCQAIFSRREEEYRSSDTIKVIDIVGESY